MTQPGTIVAGGKYRIDRVIGRGGMGIVVAATHLQLASRVALKFLDAGMAKDPKATARFLREAKACAQLRSENICRVSDFGVEGGVPFIVMELLEGVDLARLARTRSLDVATCANYIRQTCAGLAEAHAAKIIHRDLKPGNLFVTRRADGTEIIKILDFGVAKIAPTEADDVQLTGTSHVVGSPGYMAPEQIRSSRTVDARADVWSLGVILFKLVTGREPWSAKSFAEFAMAILRHDLPPLPDVPAAFEAVVRRCLEKDPDRRYPDVGALAAALEPFATGSHATPTIVPVAAMPLARPTPRPVAARPPSTLIDGSGAHQLDGVTHDLGPVTDDGARVTQYTAAVDVPETPWGEDLPPGAKEARRWLREARDR
ncbi:MAG: serine/threonine-protein kinase [Proteobacteria bacterium]|nr:serine/threonine-protein kinase [Pseudomonadota bacterium]